MQKIALFCENGYEVRACYTLSIHLGRECVCVCVRACVHVRACVCDKQFQKCNISIEFENVMKAVCIHAMERFVCLQKQ